MGLRVWDGLKEETVNSRVIVILNTADAVALTELDGRVGHHGAQGCRLGCYMKGRHKPSSGHYYAVHLCPNGYVGSRAAHRTCLRRLDGTFRRVLYLSPFQVRDEI